ncbi:hypothetical protein SPRG_04251 [Saprolegnia parasitica CBS 223.65]|uniref:Uncharacterized protein n=1 Tax=Saprolegnia parasitica (strain CBS 223.65) TaxID=695850 RepID=A0A067CWE8_SAPPC|nr:hypothetical protein SPRG_04251 [Saprolegnia parasitica CBS 223.65]KDO31112.1 hypothetical protein SPRG_04251 [Saprolegnia parasitica CBS 223.65]|eukprot:XP_012198241.1 hypothetical protein SPRG_04251 [Saprolegnia parasitica CBS 223.65]
MPHYYTKGQNPCHCLEHHLTTPLFAAAANGHTSVVKALLDADASPFQRNDKHIQPRDIAKAKDHAAIATCLEKAMDNLAQLVTALSKNDVTSTLRLLRANVPVTIPYLVLCAPTPF